MANGIMVFFAGRRIGMNITLSSLLSLVGKLDDAPGLDVQRQEGQMGRVNTTRYGNLAR